MRPTELLIVKTGMMLDTGNVHDKDDKLCEDELWELPRFTEMGISGAAGWYLLFEYDNLAEATELLTDDISAAEDIILTYEERNASYLAHPDIEGGSPCCGGYGANADEFDYIEWDCDERKYKCSNCHTFLDT